MSTKFTEAREAADQNIRDNYDHVGTIFMGDVESDLHTLRYCGLVHFSDGSPTLGFDTTLRQDGTFTSLSHEGTVEGRVVLWTP